MTSRHPELAEEQTYLDEAHDAHEATIEHHRAVVDGRINGGGDPAAQRAIREASVKKLGALEGIDTSRLIFGRLDFAEGNFKTLYVGPCTVRDDDHLKVVDFAMPKARAFYVDEPDDVVGLVLRRTFDVHFRELRDISDEAFGTGLADQSARIRTVLDRVAEELEQAREPRMQSIVASIVSDQYRLIEAAREGLFVIQGGPGTGKTAVALHRAVYLLRNNEDLGKVLVVGPNAAFMAYIASVVPGLGETRVDQLPIGRLSETADVQGRGRDLPTLAKLKGEARMAQVIQGAVRQRVRPATEPFATSIQNVTVSLEPEIANAILDREAGRDRPYMEGRRRFVEAMRAEIEGLLHERLARGLRRRTVDRDSVQRELAGNRLWANFLERMWPTASAAQVVHDLFTTESRLRQAGEGILTDTEVSMLIRREIRTVGVHPWTVDDMPLIDEAQSLVQGIGSTYGYVIVDEAQDLTPMQLRMVARRSKVGDVTLVGDIAQATGPMRYADWDEIVAHLPTDRGVRKDQLTIGYRVPRSIMALANLILPTIAPDLPATEPVREARIDPEFMLAEPGALADSVADRVADLQDDERSIGIIVPHSHLIAVRGALAARGIAAGELATDQLERRVTLLASSDAKGLEFDRVVLVEPREIVTGAEAGWNELYVALSRATQHLVIAHSLPLPAPLPGGEPIDSPDAAPEDHLPGVEPREHDPEPIDLELDLDLDLFDQPPPEPSIAEKINGADEAPADHAPAIEQPSSAPEEPVAPAFSAPQPETALGSDTAPEPATIETTPESDDVEPAPIPAFAAQTATDGDADQIFTTAGAAAARPLASKPLPERPARVDNAIGLGGTFSEALLFTKLLHDGRMRRGTAVPYLSHLLGTAALVLEDGGTEAEAVAALLHDVVEDGPPELADTIRSRFGNEVADIVIGCTDPVVPGGFRESKIQHLAELENGSTSVRRVALAEKLDNARALLRDLERYGTETWRRLEIDREEMLWYLHSLVLLFDATFPSVLADELRRVVARIDMHVGAGPSVGPTDELLAAEPE